MGGFESVADILTREEQLNDLRYSAADESRIFSITELKMIEPSLVEIERLILNYPSTGSTSFCANAFWYGSPKRPSIKRLVMACVGWEARFPVMQSSRIYEQVYRYLYNLLPPCRSCGCL